MASGVVGFYAAYSYRWAWLGLLLLGALFVWIIQARFTHLLNPTLKLWAFRLLVAGGAIVLLTPCLSWINQKAVNERLTAKQQAQIQAAKESLTAQIATQSTAVSNLAQSDYLVTGLTNPSEGSAATSLAQFMISNQLKSVILMDGLGNVRIRAEAPARQGDNLYEILPWLAPAFQGSKVAGLGLSEFGLPAVVSAAPVQKGNLILGVVLLTSTLNQSWAQNFRLNGLGLGVSSVNGLTASSSLQTDELAVYQSATLKDYTRDLGRSQAKLSLKDQINPQHQQFQVGIDLEQSQYLATGQFLDSLLPSQPIALLSMAKSSSQPQFSWMGILFSSIVLIALSIGVWIIKQRIRTHA